MKRFAVHVLIWQRRHTQHTTLHWRHITNLCPTKHHPPILPGLGGGLDFQLLQHNLPGSTSYYNNSGEFSVLTTGVTVDWSPPRWDGRVPSYLICLCPRCGILLWLVDWALHCGKSGSEHTSLSLSIMFTNDDHSTKTILSQTIRRTC